ncbi:MAG: hypothetical protein RL514_1528 [Verrucomicrobiota bacterium]|jgi:hypothetical protein
MKGIVWLASYPKSGNTWFRAFLANLLADAVEPVDINALGAQTFSSVDMLDEVVGWECTDLTLAELAALRLAAQEALAVEEPVLKVHEACTDPVSGASLFSPAATRAALYFIRNPLDVCVSYAHHYHITLDEAVAFMNEPRNRIRRKGGMNGQLPQPLGTWSHHVASWMEFPGRVLPIRYEDMLARPEETFLAACQFAGFPDDLARIRRAVTHASFDRLRAQEAANGFREASRGSVFFRSGKAGGWRNVLSPGQVQTIVQHHDAVMRRFGYLDGDGTPV